MTKLTAKTVLVALALTSLSSGALAEWTQVYASEDSKITIYADRATMRKSGATVQLQTMTDYQEDLVISGEQKFKSARMQDEFNCENQTGRHLNLSAMSDNMGKGKTVAVERQPSPWRQIKPDTADADMLKFVCEKK
jgi:hypothetical protein